MQAVIATALVSGFIVMFIDLPLPAMIGLSLRGACSSRAFGKNHTQAACHGGLAPPGVLGKKATLSLSRTGHRIALRYRNPHNPCRHLAILPGEASLATLERYWVVEPYSFVKIERVGNEGFTYIVVEPAISQKEKTILMETYAHLRDIIIYDNTEKGRGDRIDPVAVATDHPAVRSGYYGRPGCDPELLYQTGSLRLRPSRSPHAGPGSRRLSCNGHDLPVFIFHRDLWEPADKHLFYREQN